MKQSSPERLLRLKLGIDGRDLAKALGVSKTTLYAWETGKQPLTSEMRKKIREWLRNRSAA